MQLDRAHQLHSTQAWLWQQLGVGGEAWSSVDLQRVLAAARVLCLQQAELRLLLALPDVQRPISPRNEAAALALLLAHEQAVCGASPERRSQLHAALSAFPASCQVQLGGMQQPGSSSAADPAQPAAAAASGSSFPDGSPEQALHSWVLSQGAAAQVLPAIFTGSAGAAAAAGADAPGGGGEPPRLRGCAAAGDLPAGAVAVSLPAQLLITYDSAAASDFGRALAALGLDSETLAVLWTMVERWDPESPARPFWASLPDSFGTGLSAPQALVDLLPPGSAAQREFQRVRQHVRQQWAALAATVKALLTAYAAHLQASWFTEAAYLWACELWYAYAIQVKFADGRIRPALAPFVSLLNHSAAPHVVHFSSVDPASRCLRLPTFRPVAAGQQVCLSYGPLSNEHLLLFYGFALPHNPFDELELLLEPQPSQAQPQPAAADADGADAADKAALLLELGLSTRVVLSPLQPLPHGLLPSLRVLVASPAELQQLRQALAQQGADASQPQQAAGKAAAAGGGGRSKAGGKRAKGGRSSQAQPEPLQAAWAAAARWAPVLGSPVSERNERAAQARLRALLAGLRQPLEACAAKAARRQQLAAALGRGAPGEAGFVAGVRTWAEGLAALVDACAAAAGLGAPAGGH